MSDGTTPCMFCGTPTTNPDGRPICPRCSTWGPDQH